MLGSSHAISRIMIGERWTCASRANLAPTSPPVRRCRSQGLGYGTGCVVETAASKHLLACLHVYVCACGLVGMVYYVQQGRHTLLNQSFLLRGPFTRLHHVQIALPLSAGNASMVRSACFVELVSPSLCPFACSMACPDSVVA